MGKIKILHLSDLHFGIQKSADAEYLSQRREILQSFFDDFHQITEKGWTPDVIIISGDLGWFGQSDDYLGETTINDSYLTFEQFLKKLVDVSNVSLDHIICCPGNHDKEIPQNSSIGSFRHIRNIDKDSIRSIAPYFSNYSNAMRKLGLSPLTNNYTQVNSRTSRKHFYDPPERLNHVVSLPKRLFSHFLHNKREECELPDVEYLYGYREIGNICFVVLNSAWLCDYREKDATDYGNLLGKILFFDIHEKYINETGHTTPFSHVIIYHHPDNWFNTQEDYPRADIDRQLIDSMRLFSETGPLVLNGHVHNPNDLSSRNTLVYSSGTLSSNDTYKSISSQCWLFDILLNTSIPKISKIKKGKYFSYLDQETKKFRWKFNIEEEEYFSANVSERMIKNEQIAHLKQLCQHDDLLNKAIESVLGDIDNLNGLEGYILNRIVLWLAQETFDRVEIIIYGLKDIINGEQLNCSRNKTLSKHK